MLHGPRDLLPVIFGFVGNEVAKVLGYANYRNAIATHVDEEDKLRTQIEYAGQKREVLPRIRKTGGQHN